MIGVTRFLEAAADRIRGAGYDLPPDAVDAAMQAGRDWEKMRARGVMPNGSMTSFEAMERALLEMAK